MKRALILIGLILFAGNARGEGVVDFVIPGSGFSISVEGHYRLVADAQTDVDVAAITVSVNDVTIDLNGHTITAGGTNNEPGIVSSNENLRIRNGTIRGFGDSAILAGLDTRIEDCIIENNNKAGNGGGIDVGADSVVARCLVRRNTPVTTGSTFGIRVGAGSHVIGNRVEDNNSPADSCDGIVTSSSCRIEDNTVFDNDGFTVNAVQGIDVSAGTIVRNNIVRNNDNLGTGQAVGIDLAGNGIIEGNHCDNHTGGSATTGTSIGIRGTACVIRNNQCSSNNGRVGSGAAGRGIEVNTQSRVEGNHCRSNTGDGLGQGAGILVTGSNNEIRRNTCCQNNAGGVVSAYGIRVESGFNIVSENTTMSNKRAGMLFTTGANNRADSNRMREDLGIDLNPPGVNPSSLGAGDLANVTF